MADRSWTVLVWMAGDNERHDRGLHDLEELKAVGSSRSVALVAQLDRGRDGRTRRYHLRSGGDLDGDVVEDLGPTQPGDPLVAADFFAWGLAAYPAQHVMAVLWNHGNREEEGTRRPGRPQPARCHRALFATPVEKTLLRRGLARDDGSRDFVDALHLSQVLDEVKRRSGRIVDVLGLDGCLSSMAELAFQCRGRAALLIASEEAEPLDRWPYDRILRDLVTAPDLRPLGLARGVVDHYGAAYRDEAVTLAVLDLSQAATLAKAVDGLAAALLHALREGTEFVAFTRAVNAAQSFDVPHLLDLADLASQLRERMKDARVRAAAADVQARVQALVADEDHQGPTVERARGMAIYLPRGGGSMAYEKLDFARSTRWAELIARYTA